MYKLVSEYGNEVVLTDSARKRDRLIDIGYRECTVSCAPEKKKTAVKNEPKAKTTVKSAAKKPAAKKGTKKNAAKNKA